MANALAQYVNLNAATQAAEQEALTSPTTLIASPLENRIPQSGSGGRIVSAGMMTLVIAVFFFGLVWALGQLSGEALFKKVEAAV